MRKSKKMIFITGMASLLITSITPICVSANEIEDLKKDIELLKKEVKSANEWRESDSIIHMAGYADVGYISDDTPGTEDSFTIGTFAPIFHFQFKEQVMLEAELEVELEDDGSTEINIEYLTIDWFINDYAVLVAGKFLSPIGNFRQNLHPSWINKLPSAPPGFGHDGAAPVSALGIQLRGGFHIGNMKANYAVYMGNGPEVKAEVEGDGSGGIEEIEFDGVEAEAFGADSDGEKVIGGRFAIFPIDSLEVGLSLLTGDASVTEFEDVDSSIGGIPSLDDVDSSAYDVIGADISYQQKGFDAKFEYVKTEMDEVTIGAFNLESAEWATWYTQVAYRLLPSKYEVVLRVSDFDSAHDSKDIEQTAFGVNYLFSNNFIGKLGFESNDNPNTGEEAYDKWMLQLAYGF